MSYAALDIFQHSARKTSTGCSANPQPRRYRPRAFWCARTTRPRRSSSSLTACSKSMSMTARQTGSASGTSARARSSAKSPGWTVGPYRRPCGPRRPVPSLPSASPRWSASFRKTRPLRRAFSDPLLRSLPSDCARRPSSCGEARYRGTACGTVAGSSRPPRARQGLLSSESRGDPQQGTTPENSAAIAKAFASDTRWARSPRPMRASSPSYSAPNCCHSSANLPWRAHVRPASRVRRR